MRRGMIFCKLNWFTLTYFYGYTSICHQLSCSNSTWQFDIALHFIQYYMHILNYLHHMQISNYMYLIYSILIPLDFV